MPVSFPRMRSNEDYVFRLAGLAVHKHLLITVSCRLLDSGLVHLIGGLNDVTGTSARAGN